MLLLIQNLFFVFQNENAKSLKKLLHLCLRMQLLIKNKLQKRWQKSNQVSRLSKLDLEDKLIVLL